MSVASFYVGKIVKLYIFSFFVTRFWVFLPKEYLVSFENLKNPKFWYSYSILPIIKMANRNNTMMDPDNKSGCHDRLLQPWYSTWGIDRHPANVGCSFFKDTNDVNNDTNQRYQHRKWTREDNKLALHSYFRNNATQRSYRKRMIEIWEECTRFQTSQRLADLVRRIIKKGWFSVLEIHQN